MSGELDASANEADSARASSVAVGDGAGPRKTPDESTLLLPTPAGSGAASTPDSHASGSAQANDVPHLSPGELLAGRFSILRFIAQGGMGAVYVANDIKLRVGVALKVIRGRIASDTMAMERFRREVLLARRVSHPNVCRVYELYDATTASGVPIHFLSMELLDGETLSQRISRQGRLTTAEALPLVRQLCEGLAAAHAEGVIHRDFKSSNIMLVARRGASDESPPSTRVAITDFGIARAMQTSAEEAVADPLTGSASILGTPEYMAPEQVTGAKVTQAADIYAFGIVLYEMVTGKLPFTGDTPLVAAAKRLHEPPPRPEATTPDLDPRWSATVLRCLALEPGQRFKSALDILLALERPPRRLPRWASAGGLVLVLALAAFAVARVAPTLRTRFHPTESSRRAVPAAPRQVVAILGFGDELASPELTWLPTAVSEALRRELGAAETSLRVVPGDRVAQARRSLGVSEDALKEDRVRQRMQGLLRANVLVYGAVKPTARGSGSVAYSVKMVDTASGRELASVEEDLGEGGAALDENASSVGERLRKTLGASLSQEQAAALSASRPRNLSAARSYAQGLMSLRKFEYEKARSDFEAAVATDGSFLDAQRRIVDMWAHEGNTKKAREIAERIRTRQSGLTPRQKEEMAAEILSLGPEPEKGMEAWKALFDATPDDVEVGLHILSDSEPKTGSAILGRLRELSPSGSSDMRVAIDEAFNVWQLGDFKGAEELLGRVKTRAQALGARVELGMVLFTKALMLWIGQGHGAEALVPFEEAEGFYADAGELDRLLQTKNWHANLLAILSPTDTALKALEETAALCRKLGDRRALRETLHAEAQFMATSGHYHLAAITLQEASSESDAIDEPPGPYYQRDRAQLAFAQADMQGVRNALHLVRTGPDAHRDLIENEVLAIEAAVFKEQDRLEEARETLEKLVRRHEGGDAAASVFQAILCELACDEGHPRQGLDCLAQHPPPAGMGIATTANNNLRLTHCRYLAGDFEEAERAGLPALEDAQRSGLYAPRILANTYLMRIQAARGEPAKAMASLRADLRDAEKNEARMLAFDVALALGEVEIRAGRPEGRTRLLKLEQEAKAREFFRVARLARETLDGRQATPSKPVQ